LERSILGKAQQEMGDTIIPAEPPNWLEVEKKAIALFLRTKDLRIAIILVRALLETAGFTGFRDGLTLLVQLLDKHWESIHPQLDPDDSNDPTERVNILVSLSDTDSILRKLRETALVQSRAFGKFNLRDIHIASGGMPVPKKMKAVPEMSTIEAAFTDAPMDAIQATSGAVRDSITQLSRLKTDLGKKVGQSKAPDFNGLMNLLKELDKFLSAQLSRKGVIGGEAVNDELEVGPDGSVPTQVEVQTVSNRITSREDVFKALDKVIDYYKLHEPSSPVPFLLNRAKQLISKDFMEILQELVPSGIAQAKTICGPDVKKK